MPRLAKRNTALSNKKKMDTLKQDLLNLEIQTTKLILQLYKAEEDKALVKNKLSEAEEAHFLESPIDSEEETDVEEEYYNPLPMWRNVNNNSF